MLTPELTAFLEAGQCIHLGTRNDRLEPTGMLARAAIVDADRAHLTVFIPEVGSEEVLSDLAATGQAALCFGRPVDEHTCQVKGTFVGARAATKKERAIVEAQWEHSLQQLERISIPRVLYAGYALWPCLAVRIRVTALFDQTPGPGAGAPLA